MGWELWAEEGVGVGGIGRGLWRKEGYSCGAGDSEVVDKKRRFRWLVRRKRYVVGKGGGGKGGWGISCGLLEGESL